MAEGTFGPRAFVIGYPIAHSRSPLIHGHWLKSLGITGSYERVEVAPAELERFLDALRSGGFAGGNVTIPHKEETFRLVDRRDEAAERIGAVNTLWLDGGILWGGNTDAEGFSANLDAAAPVWRQARSAVVLGAGGASRAILFALRQAGIPDIRLANRTVTRARDLADRFGAQVTAHAWDDLAGIADGADLVVNTTSLGMHGEGGVAVDVTRLAAGAVVTDIVYTPLKTPLLAAAEEQGLATVDGLGMLLHQAAPGFERWFGVRPTVTTQLRDIIVADLGSAA